MPVEDPGWGVVKDDGDVVGVNECDCIVQAGCGGNFLNGGDEVDGVGQE